MRRDGSSPPADRSDHARIIRALGRAIVVEVILLALVFLLGVSLEVFGPVETLFALFASSLPALAAVAVVLLVTKLMLDVFHLAFSKAVSLYRGSETSARMLWTLVTYMVWGLVALGIVLFFAGDLWASLFYIGVIIAALIYALATPIQNIAGWMVIVLRHPYKIGNIIEVDGTKGYVVNVGLTTTTLREIGGWMRGDLYTGRLVSVPNKSLFEAKVKVYNKANQYIYDRLDIMVTYESDIARAEELLREAVSKALGKEIPTEVVKAVETRELYENMVREIGIFLRAEESGVSLGAVYLVPIPNRERVRSAATRLFLEAIAKEERVSIAYPHLEVVGVGTG